MSAGQLWTSGHVRHTSKGSGSPVDELADPWPVDDDDAAAVEEGPPDSPAVVEDEPSAVLDEDDVVEVVETCPLPPSVSPLPPDEHAEITRAHNAK